MTENTADLTIDELARQVGMTVRNVRAHQSRGLLPAPEIRGRTGYYGPEHVARLELVKDLQAEGFNLEAIRQILERTPGSSINDVLGITRALAEPFSDEDPEAFRVSDLVARWGDQITPDVVEKLASIGMLRTLGPDHIELRSPRLLATAERLDEMGIPLDDTVALAEQIRDHCQAVSKSYVNLFLDHVWRPFMESDQANDQEAWARIRDNVADIRPLAAEGLLSIFGVVMTREVERAIEAELGMAAQPPNAGPEEPERDRDRSERKPSSRSKHRSRRR